MTVSSPGVLGVDRVQLGVSVPVRLPGAEGSTGLHIQDGSLTRPVSSWETVASLRSGGTPRGVSVCLSPSVGRGLLPRHVAFPLCLCMWSLHVFFPAQELAFL